MGFADHIRIMLGKLTPAEIEERDAAARARHERKLAEIQEETARIESRNADKQAVQATREGCVSS